MIPGAECVRRIPSLSHFCPPIVSLLRRSVLYIRAVLSRCTFDLFVGYLQDLRAPLTTVILTRGHYANREALPVYCVRLNIGFYVHALTR